MVVISNISTDGAVVFVPLLSSDLPISVFIVKVAQKLQKHLILSHLAGLYFGVVRGVVNLSQVVLVNVAVPVHVEFQKSFVDHCLAALVGFSSDSD